MKRKLNMQAQRRGEPSGMLMSMLGLGGWQRVSYGEVETWPTNPLVLSEEREICPKNGKWKWDLQILPVILRDKTY